MTDESQERDGSDLWPGDSDPVSNHSEEAYRLLSPDSIKLFKHAMLASSETKTHVQYLSHENAVRLTRLASSSESVR